MRADEHIRDTEDYLADCCRLPTPLEAPLRPRSVNHLLRSETWLNVSLHFTGAWIKGRPIKMLQFLKLHLPGPCVTHPCSLSTPSVWTPRGRSESFRCRLRDEACWRPRPPSARWPGLGDWGWMETGSPEKKKPASWMWGHELWRLTHTSVITRYVQALVQ